jgi:predicted permease
MRWLHDIWFRIRALVARDRMERDLEDEVRFHIEMETRKLEAAGLAPDEALRRARLNFGGEDRFKEQTREAWGVGLLHDLGSDLRFAARQLLARPAFSGLAAVTLGLGIGGTVALFSVVHGLMLRPLPVEDEQSLVTFWSDFDWRGAEYDFVRQRAEAYDGIAAYSLDGYTLRTEAGSTLQTGTVSSAGLFDVLGVSAALGRTFRAGEDRPGAEPVVILSHGLWEREFGADPGVIGTRVDLEGRRTTVIGVMPRGFYFPNPESSVWTPLDLDPDTREYHGNGWLVLMGRVAEGVGPEQIQDDLTRVAAGLGERWDYPDAWDKTRNPHVVPIRDYLLGEVRPAVLLLLGAVGLVLLMACANVAALILTRTSDRTGEIAVRVTLGAGRARLARQIMTESVVLGVIAGGIGMGLAVAAFDVLVASLPVPASFGSTLALDWTALVASLSLAVGTGVVISLAPMRSLLGGRLSEGALRARSSSAGSTGRQRIQTGLVVGEVLLAVVLASGAALLVRTVQEIRAIDLGLEPAGVLAVDVLIPSDPTSADEVAQFHAALVEQVRGLPGVESAGLINRVPARDGGWQATLTLADRPDLEGDSRPNAFYRPVTSGTFSALGVEVIEGRGVEDADRAEGRRVAVVNETFARTMFPGESALGRIISSNGFTRADIEIVGVVRNVVIDDLVGPVPMAAYYPWSQTLRGSGYAVLVAKTSLEPVALAGPIRSLVRQLDSRAAVGRIETMDQVVDDAMAEPLRLRFFLALFSVLGIVLGSVGVYGVVSYSVQRRTPEFGIRLALGAAPGDLMATVVRAGMLPVAVGVVAGSVVALVASNVVAGFLFGVEPTDPTSLAAAAGTLFASGVIAALVPAWRASATDPGTAIRAR